MSTITQNTAKKYFLTIDNGVDHYAGSLLS